MKEVLSQDEIDRLLAVVGNNPNESVCFERQPCARLWDFARPDVFTKEHMLSISSIHEEFARLCSTSLSCLLGETVEVYAASVDQLTREEFYHSVPDASCFAELGLSPLPAALIWEIDPIIAEQMLVRLAGGKRGRERTAPEDNVLHRIALEDVVRKGMFDLKQSWSVVANLEPQLQNLHCNKNLLEPADSSEMMALVTFECRIAEHEGMMNIAYPAGLLKPLMHMLTDEYRNQKSRLEKQNIRHTTLLDTLTPELEITAPAETMPLKSLIVLKEGDSLKLTGRWTLGQDKLSLGSLKPQNTHSFSLQRKGKPLNQELPTAEPQQPELPAPEPPDMRPPVDTDSFNAFSVLQGIPPERLTPFLQSIHPQIAALLLTHTAPEPEQFEAILKQLPADLAVDIKQRAGQQGAVSKKLLVRWERALIF